MAVAEIESEPDTGESWRDDGSRTKYVDLIWLECVPLHEMLTVDELKFAIPDFPWDSVYSSGRDITPYGDQLESLWADRAQTAAASLSAVQGAGSFGEAEQNKKVETAAVRHATKAYEDAGYQVTSVESEKCGWDLTATRSEEEVHVEVKGVGGPVVQYFLTANEYNAAATDPHWLLVVV